MGKVRILLIKRVARKMVEQYPDKFSRDFGQNKLALAELKLTRRLRNRIAGYISALMTPSKVPVAIGEEKPLMTDGEEEEGGEMMDQEGRALPKMAPQEEEMAAEASAAVAAPAAGAEAEGEEPADEPVVAA